jgi:hypothetical protein
MPRGKQFDWENYPNVGVVFHVIKPFDTREVARAFLEIQEHYGLAPDHIDIGWERYHFVPLQTHIGEYYQRWLSARPQDSLGHSKGTSLRRVQTPRGSADTMISATGHTPFDWLHVDLETSFFKEPAHQRRFLEMARHLYVLLSPAYGRVEYSITDLTRTGTVYLKRGLPGIFWGNFLGPEYSAMFGWDRLQALARDLPVTVERLPDDGVLILLGGNVLDSGSPAMLARAEAAERFLGEEYFARTPPSWPPKPLPFSLADVEAGRVPPDVLRQTILRPPPPEGRVPAFRFQESRRERQAEWARSGGMTVEEVAADLGLELKGPGGVIMVDAATGRGVDLPGSLFEDKPEDTEEDK